MTTILVPYHHDEPLPDDGIPVRADVTVRPNFPAAGLWQRLTALCAATADAVAPVVAAGGVPTVLSGLLFPAPGGPSAGAVVAACRRLLATGRVVAVDIACPWRPAVDDAERATRTALVADLTSTV
ncbi:hypothetical protein [Actinoplanes sp. NPDC049118]|uniref:hypothetical protein n=1 Tax=Actinoplanes sp. NPDC049118 TaxID=3155769 RepID=UPI00340D70F9